jgi:Ty3 transposon capsid-like protein/Zinc knuckle
MESIMYTSDTSNLGLTEAELQAMGHIQLDADASSQIHGQMGTPTQVHPRTLFSELKPPRPRSFSGKKDHNVIESWVSSVNSYFALTNVQPPYIYHYLNTLFVGEAAIWFRYHYPETVASTLTWEQVRENLHSFFIPPNKDRRLQDQWAQLRQLTSVSDYIARFCSLAMQLPAQQDNMMIHKFIRGLKSKTRMELELKDPQSLNEAFHLADRFDSIVYQQKFNNFTNKPLSKPTVNIQYEDGEPMQLDTFRTMAPKVNKNTPKSLQPLSTEERTRLQSIGACFKCRRPGHMARECSNTSGQAKPSSGNFRRQ